MSAGSLLQFLCSNSVDKTNLEFVKKEMEQIKVDCWMGGYNACILHNKKRRMLRDLRITKCSNDFLDYLADITVTTK